MYCYLYTRIRRRYYSGLRFCGIVAGVYLGRGKSPTTLDWWLLHVGEIESVDILVDDAEVTSLGPLTLMQICLENYTQLPRFCYHPELGIAGNCRICLIEEEAEDKMLLACSTIAEEGDIVHTASEKILQARESVMEYLLINHPLDCPICDRGGECDLQDQALLFGADRGRFYEPTKRAVAGKNCSALIKFFLNRCIQCSRCTRFLADISGSDSLFLLGRGLNTEITSYVGSYIFDEFSGNIIDLCPVGALTSKPLAFTLRFWELADLRSFDIFDVFLSPIKVELRGSSIMRVLPSSSQFVTEYWISDKVRFNFDGYTKQRILRPMFQCQNRLLFLNYNEALLNLKHFIALNLNSTLHRKNRGIYTVGHWGGFSLIEDVFSSKSFLSIFGSKFGSVKYAGAISKVSAEYFRAQYINPAGSGFLKRTKLLLLFTDVRLESPTLFMKLRERIIEEDCQICNIGSLTPSFEYDEFAGANTRSLLMFLVDNICSDTLIIMNNEGRKDLHKYLLNFCTLLATKIPYYFDGGDIILNNASTLFFLNSSELGTGTKVPLLSSLIDACGGINFLWDADVYSTGSCIKSKFLLSVFTGTHGNSGVKPCNIIFPAKIFLEKSHSSININGILHSYLNTTFRYFIEDMRTLSEVIALKAFYLGGLSATCRKSAFLKNNTYSGINLISPLFRAGRTSYILFQYFRLNSLYGFSLSNPAGFICTTLLRSKLFNIFFADYFSRASTALLTHYSRFTTRADFNFVWGV